MTLKGGIRVVFAVLVATLASGPVLPASAGPIEIDVVAKVQGHAAPQTIGKLTAEDGYNHPSGMRGRFEFAKGFAFLDDHYDFDWVNVVRKLSDGYKPNFPKGAPAIDPQSGDVSGAPEDDYPYYYHFKDEWKENKFGAETIWKEGEFSQFFDFPRAPEGEFLDFSAILVVRDHDSVKFEGKDQFGLLAAWDWRYDGDKNFDGKKLNGVSKLGDKRPVDDALRQLVNDAMANEHRDAFKGWVSLTNFTLIPTPGTLALLGFGGLLAAHRRRAA